MKRVSDCLGALTGSSVWGKPCGSWNLSEAASKNIPWRLNAAPSLVRVMVVIKAAFALQKCIYVSGAHDMCRGPSAAARSTRGDAWGSASRRMVGRSNRQILVW
jgi:hypothetical protein